MELTNIDDDFNGEELELINFVYLLFVTIYFHTLFHSSCFADTKTKKFSLSQKSGWKNRV